MQVGLHSNHSPPTSQINCSILCYSNIWNTFTRNKLVYYVNGVGRPYCKTGDKKTRIHTFTREQYAISSGGNPSRIIMETRIQTDLEQSI